jgi:hypothetical protein
MLALYVAGSRFSIDLQGTAGPLLSGGGAGLGGSVFAQLLLDMHRHVGVMLVDRMSAGAVSALTKHLQAAIKVSIVGHSGASAAETPADSQASCQHTHTLRLAAHCCQHPLPLRHIAASTLPPPRLAAHSGSELFCVCCCHLFR